MAAWRNWSGSVLSHPARIERPSTEADLQALVAGATKVRVAGTGHSFMPLCETGDLLLCLDQMRGAVEIAADRRSAWVPAGMAIGALTKTLWAEGMSLANQGDIDKQAIAGALATATHGTGRTLGCLSTFAEAFRLVLAGGEVVECDAERHADLFEAQRVGLGALGVLSRVRLSVVPGFRLRESVSHAPLEALLDDWDAMTRRHRHVELFVFPYADQAILKILEPVDAGDDPPPDDHGEVFQLACDIAAAAPALAGPLQRLMTRASGASMRAAPAFQIFPSERDTRFEEMEYEIPEAAGPDTLRAAIAEVRRRRLPIIFPFEFRIVAGDDLMLSPMSGGEARASISFHQYAKMPWREAFAAIEPVLAATGGRPHWAKRHTLTADDVLRLYPQAMRWGEIRRRHDPAAKFLNQHLEALFSFSL